MLRKKLLSKRRRSDFLLCTVPVFPCLSRSFLRALDVYLWPNQEDLSNTLKPPADVSRILYGFEHRLLASRASPQATSSSELTQLILVERENQKCSGLAGLCPLLECGHHFSCLMMRFLPHLAPGVPGRVHSALDTHVKKVYSLTQMCPTLTTQRICLREPQLHL